MRSTAAAAATAVPLVVIIGVLSLPDPRGQSVEPVESPETQPAPYEPDPRLMERRSYGPIDPVTGADVGSLSVEELALRGAGVQASGGVGGLAGAVVAVAGRRRAQRAHGGRSSRRCLTG